MPLIPILIVFGLLAGRWWRSALVVGTVGWTAALMIPPAVDSDQLLATALFGLVNTGVGVAIHQGIARSLHRTHVQNQIDSPVA